MGHRDLPFAARTVTVTCPGLPEIMGQPALVFSRLEGREGLCELFEYRLDLRTPDDRNAMFGPAANLDTKALRGQELTITIALEGTGTGLEGNLGAGKREITGIVTEVHGPIPVGRQITYRLTLRPWLWLATRNRDFRIFQNQTAAEMLDELLSDYSFPVERRIDVTRYPKREFQVQYGESDFEYFQRITQEWGIAWHIEHSDGRHRLVLTDGNGAFAPFRGSSAYHTIRWQPSSDRIDEEHLHHFELHERVVSGTWTTGDYDFTRPRANLTVLSSDPLDTAHADHEVREWPGDHSQPATGNDPRQEGDQIARLRMEAIRQHGTRASGRGNVRAMVPGCSFTLENFIQHEANREYLILDTTLLIEDVPEASGGAQSWHCEAGFTAQPSNEMFRPERTQPKPRTTGPQTATVVGPENQETWTDQYGRVRVQFHWDRRGKRNADSSCWVRVSSAWQGERFGAIHIPRIGQEVIVDFLNGDPDCPIITGRVPNQLNMPQWPMPSHHALSGLVSKENHGERANTFVQDDTQGQIQTQVQSDHQSSGLSLGFITRVLRGVGRKDKRGEGFELRTDAHGVVRAGGGMLVTTERRANAAAHHKDMSETVQRLTVARDQQETLAELAQEHEAQEVGDQAEVAKALKAQNDDIKGSGAAHPESGSFPELAAPHLVLASPAGIEATTAQSIHLATGEHVAISSTGHTSLSTGKRLLASVSRGVRVFIQSMGWRLVAAGGDIDLRALQDSIKLLAKLNITATANRITLSAKEEIVINGGGSASTWNGGGIVHKTGAAYTIHAGSYSLTAGQKVAARFPEPPKPGKGNLELINQYASRLGIRNGAFQVEDALGKVTQGKLDSRGFARVNGIAPGPAEVTFEKDPANTWAEASHIIKARWPEADTQGEADGLGSMAALVGDAARLAQGAQQVASAVKAGPAALAGLALSGGKALASLVLPTAGQAVPAAPTVPPLNVRTTGFI